MIHGRRTRAIPIALSPKVDENPEHDPVPHKQEPIQTIPARSLQGKFKQLDKRFDKQLKDNWGLETLVTVGESWLPAMLEQDDIGEATDIPVLKLFEFLVASICLFMIEDDTPPEPRELDLFKLSAPRAARGPGQVGQLPGLCFALRCSRVLASSLPVVARLFVGCMPWGCT